MNIIRLCVVSLLLLAPSLVLAQGATWPNKPAGFTTILDCPFNDQLCGRALQDGYNSSGLNPSPPSAGTLNMATDSSPAMVSPSSVIRSHINAGSNNGGTELIFPFGSTQREAYVGMMWRTNPEFQGRPNSNKLFFLRGPQANGVWIFGNSALVNGSAPWIFGHNTGGGLLDNSHACALDLGLACYPNTGADGSLHVGTWTKLEAYVKASTTNTSRDGVVKWWKNGVLVGNYTNLNYGGVAGLTEWVWSETWDGAVNPVPSVMWAHFIDHLIVAVGSGGGGTPPPPPPDTTPPGQVTSVTVTQLK